MACAPSWHTEGMRFRLLIGVVFLLSIWPPLQAHPGVGIVMDGRGNVYYTDLERVWKITPAGEKSVAVRDVHTHELYVDPQDNLYGEHLWYEGEKTDRWGHRVWKLAADGKLTDVIPARQGFRDDYDDFHFVRDRQGSIYWVDRGEPDVIRKRSPEGVVTTLATAPFEDVRWMTVTPEGTVYLVDRQDLVRIAPNSPPVTVARGLADRTRDFLFFENRHAVMGLWTDPAGNVYAAITTDALVRRITPEGKVEIAARSFGGWYPTGGFVAPNGDLWLLEYGRFNKARARRIDKAGKSTVFE